MMRTLAAVVLTAVCVAAQAAAQTPAPPKAEKKESAGAAAVRELTVQVRSTKDGTDQPVVFYVPPDVPAGTKLPLLVQLHSWSGDNGQASGYLSEVRRRRWIMVAPNFRGPNNKPEACASELAVQDVLDAVEYARQHAPVDDSRIYVTGSSGGGHMSLVMLARAPQLWAGVSAGVPITDLVAWHAHSSAKGNKYARDIEKVCGGPPSLETMPQYRARSSIFHLEAAKGVPTDITAGIHDGHTGSVPISHSLKAFNVLAEANGHADRKLTDDQIAEMTETRRVPASLEFTPRKDAERKRQVLFRRDAGPVRVVIFEGGHETEIGANLDWLSRQRKGRAVTHDPTIAINSRPSDVTEVPK